MSKPNQNNIHNGATLHLNVEKIKDVTHVFWECSTSFMGRGGLEKRAHSLLEFSILTLFLLLL
jgi:hypothetical protein